MEPTSTTHPEIAAAAKALGFKRYPTVCTDDVEWWQAACGHVEANAMRTGEGWAFYVADNAPGLPSAEKMQDYRKAARLCDAMRDAVERARGLGK